MFLTIRSYECFVLVLVVLLVVSWIQSIHNMLWVVEIMVLFTVIALGLTVWYPWPVSWVPLDWTDPVEYDDWSCVSCCCTDCSNRRFERRTRKPSDFVADKALSVMLGREVTVHSLTVIVDRVMTLCPYENWTSSLISYDHKGLVQIMSWDWAETTGMTWIRFRAGHEDGWS